MTPAALAEWIRVAPWLVAAVLLIMLAVWAVRKAAPVLRKLGHLVDDLVGEPARPGVEARPGLMERMEAVEKKAEIIRHEMFPNSGASLRDAVDQQGRAIARIDEKLAADYERIEAVEETVAEIVDTRMTEAIETIKENP